MLVCRKGELQSLPTVVGCPPSKLSRGAQSVIGIDELTWLVLVPDQGTLYQVHAGHPWRQHVYLKDSATDYIVCRPEGLLYRLFADEACGSLAPHIEG